MKPIAEEVTRRFAQGFRNALNRAFGVFGIIDCAFVDRLPVAIENRFYLQALGFVRKERAGDVIGVVGVNHAAKIKDCVFQHTSSIKIARCSLNAERQAIDF